MSTQRHYNRSSLAPSQAAARRSTEPEHKYKVGQEVRFLRAPAGRLTREVEQSLFAASFEISRLLPVSSAEAQYRVKNRATGQERVAAETELMLVGDVL
jgi:hypothetical protein